MSKSYVSMEQKVCIITGKTYDTNSILLDKRLRNSMDRNTISGWGISPEAQDIINTGKIALVGVDESKSKITNGNIKPEDAYRTGEIVYIKKSIADNMFNIAINNDFIFVDKEVISIIKNKTKDEK